MFSIVQDAGWPIWFLILCSIVTIVFIVERFINLQSKKIIPPELLQEAIAVCKQKIPSAEITQKLANSSLLGGVLASGVKVLQQNPRATESDIRSAMETSGNAAMHTMERFLPALATIVAMAPLLGLFGTVIGMIEIFGAQQVAGQGDPTTVAHGISVALYNTALGLLVAIVALIFYRYFRSRVDAYALRLEQSAEYFSRYLVRFVEPSK